MSRAKGPEAGAALVQHFLDSQNFVVSFMEPDVYFTHLLDEFRGEWGHLCPCVGRITHPRLR